MEQQYKCVFCGYIGPIWRFHVDHSIPLSRGGNSSIYNLQPTCSGCNLQEGTKTSAEYIAWRYLNLLSANYGPR